MRKKNILPLNLQLFADDNAGDGTSGAAASGSDAKTENNPDAADSGADKSEASNVKPTLEELMKDKDFSEAYQKSVEEQVQKALEKKAEEDKLAAMSPEEKEQKRAADLDAREKAVLEKELRLSAAEKLSEANVPKELAELVNYSSQETMETTVKTVVDTFNKAVQAGVDSKLVGGGVMKKAPETKDTVDEEAIMKAVRGEI